MFFRNKVQHKMSNLNEEELDTLINTCLAAKEFSYSPYSKFRVGAALLCQDGKVVKGCNVENVSYGLAICAERTAYTKAISEGSRSFRAIAVCTDVKDQFVYPCGACRQFMSEFGDVEVILVDNDRNYKRCFLKELLPNSFDSHALTKGQQNNTT